MSPTELLHVISNLVCPMICYMKKAMPWPEALRTLGSRRVTGLRCRWATALSMQLYGAVSEMERVGTNHAEGDLRPVQTGSHPCRLYLSSSLEDAED